MLGLYPWGWRMGEPLNAGYYREHLGLCADGKSRVFRVGNVPSGPPAADGVSIMVKRGPKGFVYEWAYPKASLRPLELKPDARFRLSLAALDRDLDAAGKPGSLGAVQLGGFNLNIDAQPTKWREFIMVE